MRYFAVFIGIVWTLPITLPGVLLGLAGMLKGARLRLCTARMMLVFENFPLGSGALTLGNVVLCSANSLETRCMTYRHQAGLATEPAVSLAAHEQAHVLQYMVLGVLFLPVYFACGGISVNNRFERAADRYAMTGKGWWPWPTPSL